MAVLKKQNKTNAKKKGTVKSKTKTAGGLYGKKTNAYAYPIRGKGSAKVRCAFYCSKKDKGDRLLYAQFSPSEFEFERSAVYAEMTSPGMNYPIFQFVRGEAYEITVDLFFYDLPKGKHGAALEYACNWLMSMLPPDTNKKAQKKKGKKSKIPATYTPPTVDFRFGVFKQKVVIKKVKKHYDRMNSSGRMKQGKVTVTMIRVGKNTHF